MAKATDEIRELRQAYARLFETRDGVRVLEDLAKRFYDNPMDGDDLSREAGKRDVVHYIKQKVKQNAQ